MDMHVKLEGWDDLGRDLRKAITIAPVEMKKGLRKVGNEFRRDARKITPDSGIAHKQKLKRKYGIKMKDAGVAAICLVYNSAPHFHLVEQGHNMVTPGGKRVGFVEGRFMMEKTKNQYESIMPKRLDKIAGEILKGSGLH
ncbi:MAG: HK97 gp10 family phage protein [Lachnoclostridium sp.]|jgi:hypothetical protein|nr:HK97 gp10 family phage protein [Lachnoclostridium sp.]